MKIVNPVEHAKIAAEEYRKLYGSDCLSVILYGSGAGGDFDPKKSDINLLIILTAMDPQLIAKSANIQTNYKRLRFSRPLFIDKSYIAHSNDSYPMEFLDMKGCYKVLFGEDVLNSVTTDAEYLRLQVERELKGKWLHLVHEFADAKKNRKNLSRLIQLSLKAYIPVFRALLHIRGVPIPGNRNNLLEAIEAAYSLVGRPFQRVAESCIRGTLAGQEQAFIEYTRAVKKILDTIDIN